MASARLTTWLEWYRLARQQLELEPPEAAAYANVRWVEEHNRRNMSDHRKV